MKRSPVFILLISLVENQMTYVEEHGHLFKLPEPETRGDMSVEQAIE